MSLRFAAPITDAFEALVSSRLGTIVRGLEPCATTGGATCRIALPVPQPNPAGLPDRAEFDVHIPSDRFGRVALVAVDELFKGFAHQSNDGTLCLESDRNSVSGPARVLSHVRGAIEWIADAVHGRLLQPGQPWELPDFRFPSTAAPLFFIEGEGTFASWHQRVGQHGRADLAIHTQGRAVVPLAFYRDGEVIHRTAVTPSFAPQSVTSPCGWLMIDTHVFDRHRAARTFFELEQVAKRCGADLWQVVHRALKRPSIGGHRYLLVGAPIPKIVGGKPTEVHWQAIAISNALLQAALREPVTKDSMFRRKRLRLALHNQLIPWAESKNVSNDRLIVRGGLEDAVRPKRICVVGCGALGGPIATMLARGGVRDLALFDPQSLELENLGRHVLPVSAVGTNKALALAAQLRGCYPNSAVVGHPFMIPLPDVRNARDARMALEQADVLIDCSADESVLQWVSEEGRRRRIPVIHMYLNAGATLLTIVASGKHATAAFVDRALYDEVVRGSTPVTPEEYYPPIEIETGAGCWSPTFPGRGSDIAMLTSSAMPIIESLLAGPRRSRGRAIVIRRHDPDPNLGAQSLVDVAFVREYR